MKAVWRAESASYQADPAQLSCFTGRFHNGVAGDVLITCADLRLFFYLVKIDRTEPYIALSDVAFTGGFGTLIFEIDPDGKAASFNINDSFVFSRVASEQDFSKPAPPHKVQFIIAGFANIKPLTIAKAFVKGLTFHKILS